MMTVFRYIGDCCDILVILRYMGDIARDWGGGHAMLDMRFTSHIFDKYTLYFLQIAPPPRVSAPQKPWKI